MITPEQLTTAENKLQELKSMQKDYLERGYVTYSERMYLFVAAFEPLVEDARKARKVDDGRANFKG